MTTSAMLMQETTSYLAMQFWRSLGGYFQIDGKEIFCYILKPPLEL